MSKESALITKRPAKRSRFRNRMLEPGYWGHLERDDLDAVRAALQKRPQLAYAWGFDLNQENWSDSAIRSVAMWGDPDNRVINARLVEEYFSTDWKEEESEIQ